jgi:hypothetical protein
MLLTKAPEADTDGQEALSWTTVERSKVPLAGNVGIDIENCGVEDARAGISNLSI